MIATRWGKLICLLTVLTFVVAPQLGCKSESDTAGTEVGVEGSGTSSDADADVAEPAGTPYTVEVPAGLPPLPIPENNPMTEEKIALGKQLYFDTRLSDDNTVSCATCHDPTKGWTDNAPTSTGIDGQVGGANAPTVINSAYATSQFWDGRAADLEEQALGPIENPIEMGHDLEVLIGQLADIDEYDAQFHNVFGTGPTKDGIAKAIAAFERTIISGDSAYDKYMAGDKSALTEQQVRGLDLFDTVGCADCHTPPLFSNYRFHNAGVGMDKDPPDQGRKAVTENDQHLGQWRVPTLRDAAVTGPYFHDGSGATLEEVVKLMATGGIANPNLSGMMLEDPLTEEEQADLVAFIKGLSGNFPVVEPPTPAK